MLKSSCALLNLPKVSFTSSAAQSTSSNSNSPNGTSLKPSYIHRTSNLPLFYRTIGQEFRKKVEQRPDQELFVFKEQNLRKTYHQVLKEAEDLARGLIHLGIQRGDRVGIWGPNYYEWTLVQFACAIAGFVQVNVNPAYQFDEFRYAMRKVGVKALITPPSFKTTNYYNILCCLCPNSKKADAGIGYVDSSALPELKHLIMFEPGNKNYRALSGAWGLNEVMKSGGSEDQKVLMKSYETTRADDPVNIQYTSGTTGLQKAATLTHFGMLNNAYLVGVDMGYNESTNLCLPNPLFHCFGCVIGTLTVPMLGGKVSFPAPWFNPLTTAACIDEEKCNALYGTPTMFVDVLELAKKNNKNLSSLKKGIIGGSPCPVPLCKELVDNGMTELVTSYGMTEMSSVITLTRIQDDPLARIKNVGFPIPHLEIMLTDSEGTVVSRGTSGEVWCRGFGIMREYYDQPKETTKTIGMDKWLRTGDMGYMNEDGSLVINGRSKEMIIRGGENIYPAEIEQFLFKHPSILNAYVVGIPDTRWGEEVCVVIRLKSGADPITEQDVKDFCKGKISHFKVPKYVLFEDEKFIPLTPSGKVKKFVLAEECRKKLGKTKTSAFE